MKKEGVVAIIILLAFFGGLIVILSSLPDIKLAPRGNSISTSKGSVDYCSILSKPSLTNREQKQIKDAVLANPEQAFDTFSYCEPNYIPVSGGGCPADLDGDGEVDVVDLLILLSAWGNNPNGDVDGDGDTDVTDLLNLISSWGICIDPFSPECSDLEDNDGDGFTDYPSDFGCVNSEDNYELYYGPETTECNDGVDNDGDGFSDIEDEGCSLPQDEDESNCGDNVCEGHENFYFCDEDCPSECNDGVDNDDDGLVDLNDIGCEDSEDNDESNCGDNSCEGGESFPTCSVDCNPACSDIIDNDKDGVSDMQDPDCDNPEDNSEFDEIAYDQILSDHRVTIAIESNEYAQPGNYMDFLLMKIQELETGDTGSWNDYSHPPPFTEDELLYAYLQKVALSIYAEAHNLVPWSIFDYNENDLIQLLSDDFDPDEEEQMFNSNPLLPFRYATELYDLYPDQIATRQDLVDIVIFNMREDHWLHIPGSSWDPYCGMGEDYSDFECLENIRKGTSPSTSLFIYSITQTQNIPSDWGILFPSNHGWIRFVSLDLAMNGDDVYDKFKAGFKLQPNFLPVGITYITEEQYEDWNLNYLSCTQFSFIHTENVLEYLNLYDDPEWNSDVLESFCFTNFQYTEPGDFLEVFVFNINNACQDTNPQGNNFQAPPLTDEEWEVWKENLHQYALC